jgi:hypothetical protein
VLHASDHTAAKAPPAEVGNGPTDNHLAYHWLSNGMPRRLDELEAPASWIRGEAAARAGERGRKHLSFEWREAVSQRALHARPGVGLARARQPRANARDTSRSERWRAGYFVRLTAWRS